jgi:hypothetical protein
MSGLGQTRRVRDVCRIQQRAPFRAIWRLTMTALSATPY